MNFNEENKTQRVTLKQIAEAVGVSLATASYALNNGGSVGRETRDRVIAEALRMGYRPNPSAKAMRTGLTGAIGMVLPDLTNPFFPLLAQCVIHAAREQGYCVFLTDTQGTKEVEALSIHSLIGRGVDGIVWFPIDDVPGTQPNLQGVPTIVLDRNIDGFDSVLADFAAGGRIAARHLVDAGHQQIGIISGPANAHSSRLRAESARDYVLAHANLAWQVEAAYSTDLDPAIVQTLLNSDATAVIAGDDMIAIGAIRALQHAGRRVPQDVSVIGFDNIAWGELCAPSLTTIDLPVSEMASEAVAMLLRRIKAPDEQRRRTVFDVSLVKRDSVAPLSESRRVRTSAIGHAEPSIRP